MPDGRARGRWRPYHRGADGYEQARRDAVWNGRKPGRFPAEILVAASAQDVVEGVRYAKEKDLKVGVRSGGHSVIATGVREGGMLIDLSRLRDVEARTAWVGPGARGKELSRRLRGDQLSFPYGGCPTVGLGGYLLTGGYGLNGKALGSGAVNIKAVDVVTADGELIRADENTNGDYYWAARGGGYGFFGIVVGFQVRLHDAAGHLMRAVYDFSLDDYDELAGWFLANFDALDPKLTTLVFGLRLPDLGPVFRILALAFGDSEAESRELFRPLAESAAIDRAVSRQDPGR